MENLLAIKEASALLNVSEMSLRRWTNSGKLKCYRVGGKSERRFNSQDLINFLRPGEQGQTPLGIGEHRVNASAHIAHFYQTVEESLDKGISYLGKGLFLGEKVLVVSTADRLPKLLKGLENSGLPVRMLIDDGTLAIDTGRTSPAEQIQFMTQAILGAKNPQGFRLLGDMEWALEKNWSLADLTILEQYTNSALAQGGKIFLCQYDLEQFGASAAMMALETHRLTSYRGELKESPYFADRLQ